MSSERCGSQRGGPGTWGSSGGGEASRTGGEQTRGECGCAEYSPCAEGNVRRCATGLRRTSGGNRAVVQAKNPRDALHRQRATMRCTGSMLCVSVVFVHKR